MFVRNIPLFLGILAVIQVGCPKIVEKPVMDKPDDIKLQQCQRSMNSSMVNFLDEIKETDTTMKVEERAIQMDKTLRKAINKLIDSCWNDSRVPAEHANAQIERTDNFENIHQVTLQRYDVELEPEPKPSDHFRKKSKSSEKPLDVKPIKPTIIRPTSDMDDTFSSYFKRQFMRDMMKLAWGSYRNSTSWGHGQLKFGDTPGKHRWSYEELPFWDTGATIVTSLDTLIIMDLFDEYKEGRDWIEKHLTLNGVSGILNVRRILIGYVGGLLTCYTFSGDEMFKEKALHIGEYLLRAYKNSQSGLPSDWYLLGAHEGPLENTDENITEMPPYAAVSLEFDYLSEVTGIKKFSEKNRIALEHAKTWSNQTLRGLLRNYFLMHFPTDRPTIYGEAIARSDGHYLDYLLKTWLRGGSSNQQLQNVLTEAMEYAVSSLIRTSSGNLTFVRLDSKIAWEDLTDALPNNSELTSPDPPTVKNSPTDDKEVKEEKMALTSCYLGGMFALASAAFKDKSLKESYLKLGAKIANTCHEAHVRTISRLAPVMFGFANSISTEAKNNRRNANFFAYYLSSSAAESYFHLWRLTHDAVYRKWGWELALMIKAHCKTNAGFAGKLDVEKGILHDGQQHSVFLSETLKYLYLLFTDDDVLPLDEWVFNANAHAFPVQGTQAFQYSVFEAYD